MKLSFSLDDTKVVKRLGKISGGVTDFRKPFDAAGKDLLAFFGGEVFETQGKALGESWRELAASTLIARDQGRGHYARRPEVRTKILWWTGDLKRGFKKDVKKLELRIHNVVPYFKYHQKRGGRPPQRRMLAINARVITIVVERVAEHTSKLVGS